MFATGVGCDVDAVGDVFLDVEMRVQAPLHLPVADQPLEQRRLGHARSARTDQQRPIHQRQQRLQVLQSWIASQGPRLFRQFGNDRLQQFGIESAAADRASENDPSDTRGTPSFFCTAFNFDPPRRIEVQIAIARRFPLATDLVQPLKQRQQSAAADTSAR